MLRLHAFLEESDAESVRQQHVSSRYTVTRRSVFWAQRHRKPVRGAGSSKAAETVSLPQSGAYTVQALMDLVLPRFAGLGDGASVKYTSRGRYRLIYRCCWLQVVGIQVVVRTE